MAETSNATSQQCAEINNLNGKLAFDDTLSRENQASLDNQADARAWAMLKLRIANNAATADSESVTLARTVNHFAQIGLLQAGQTGMTENQQVVSPVRTGTGDAIVGGVGVSAEQVAANIANLVTSITPIIAASLASAIVQTIATLVPVATNASGGASTPSQTQPKPAA